MLPRGIRNNNPLNIRHSHANQWLGLRTVQTDSEFCQFETVEWGIRAAYRILRAYRQRAVVTTGDIIYQWAPPKENDTRAYLRTVCRLTGYEDYRYLPTAFWPRLLWAMAKVECGSAAPPLNVFEDVYQKMINNDEL